MGKIIKEVTTEKTNFQTGETESETKERTVVLPTEPPFVKLYLNDIVKLYNLPARCSDTIHALLGQMNYDGIITLSAPAKRRIAAQLGTTTSVIDNQLSRLTKTDVLQRIDRGEYMLNPSLFAKGSWADVRRLRDRYIELRVFYNEKTGDREITTTFNEGEEK